MYDTIIIGAGPAGLTASLYALRFRLQVLVVDKMPAGGYLHFIDHLENYPGFPGGIAGPDLAERIIQQVQSYDFNFKQAEVSAITASGPGQGGWQVRMGTESLMSKTVIIATGSEPQRLGIPGETELTGHGVSYCAICDAPFFKNKEVVVVGGGNTALEEALYLTGFASKVTLVHRRGAFRGDAVLQEKVERNKKIELILNANCEQIIGQNAVQAVRIREGNSAPRDIACQGMFIFVGMRPSTGFIQNLLKKNEFGYIITDEVCATGVPGVFACGDCVQVPLRQVITACGKGAVAAYAVRKFLESMDNGEKAVSA